MKLKTVIVSILFICSIGLLIYFFSLENNKNPENITVNGKEFIITKTVLKESISYSIMEKATGKTIYTLMGSTDLLCDEPLLLQYDVDKDGFDDLYFRECGGHSYYRIAGTGTPQMIDGGQNNNDFGIEDSWYFNALKRGFSVEKLIAAVIGLISGGLFFYFRKNR